MPRPRKGSLIPRNGKLYARVTWIDPDTGKQRAKERQIKNEGELAKTLRQLENELEQSGPEIFEGEKMTFEVLARLYAAEHHKPAKIVNDRKVEGLKGLRQAKGNLAVLVEHFGHRRIRSITYRMIADFKQLRLDTPTQRDGQRQICSVNRELQELRKVFKFAQQNRWINHSPFAGGQPLINVADEKQRMRILSPEEEAGLLAQCVGLRSHLRGVIITAIDTFLRPNELFNLRVKDVKYADGIVEARSVNTKTMVARQVGMTSRVREELLRLTTGRPAEAKVFEIASVKRSWMTACQNIGLQGVRFYDLRHTGITRRLEAVVRARLPWQTVMKESGHTQFKTFMVYFNPDIKLLLAGAEAMEQLFTPQEREMLISVDPEAVHLVPLMPSDYSLDRVN